MSLVSAAMKYHPEFCNTETRISDLMYILKKYNYHEVYILDSENRPIGVINERDINNEILAKSLHPFDVKAKDLMTNISTVVSQNSTLAECQLLMEANHLTVLPVVDEKGHYLGVVNKKDFFSDIDPDLQYIY